MMASSCDLTITTPLKYANCSCTSASTAAAPQILLPTNMIELFKKHDELVKWVKVQCQLHVLKCVDENLLSCGLTPDRIESSLDPNEVSPITYESLLHATIKYIDKYSHQEQYLLALLRNGADPNKVNPRGETPLMYCCLFDRVKLAKILLNYSKTNICMQDQNGNTALAMTASMKDHEHSVEIIKMIIHAAIKRGKFSLFAMRNNKGETAEDTAVECEFLKAAQLLSSKRVRLMTAMSASFGFGKRSSSASSTSTKKTSIDEGSQTTPTLTMKSSLVGPTKRKRQFGGIVLSVMAAKRWRRFAANNSNELRRATSAVNFNDLHLAVPMSPPTAQRKRSRSQTILPPVDVCRGRQRSVCCNADDDEDTVVVDEDDECAAAEREEALNAFNDNAVLSRQRTSHQTRSSTTGGGQQHGSTHNSLVRLRSLIGALCVLPIEVAKNIVLQKDGEQKQSSSSTKEQTMSNSASNR